MAKATVKVTKTKTRTRTRVKKENKNKGKGQKRCPTCGKFMQVLWTIEQRKQETD